MAVHHIQTMSIEHNDDTRAREHENQRDVRFDKRKVNGDCD